MNIGLFFGAGAEISYGLPSGGKFAMDLFRQDPSEAKAHLREQLERINLGSNYATEWLPNDFMNKRIHAFGKQEFGSLIRSTVDAKRREIIETINNFDDLATRALTKSNISRTLLESKFRTATERELGDETYSQRIRLNPILAQEVQLFNTHIYSACLDLVKLYPTHSDLRKYVVAFLQLIVGAHGKDLINNLNSELFTNAPDDLSIFDDLGGLFQIEYSRGGLTAVELLLEHRTEYSNGEEATPPDLFCCVLKSAIELLFEGILNYEELIDSHFRFLFTPKRDWPKFTKMVNFLNIARDYIVTQLDETNLDEATGYYNDIGLHLESDISISAIGTANYNNILETVADTTNLPEIIHLNGSVSDYYNPYKNTVNTYEEAPENEQIEVPFMLTQSGVKPLTSITMSRRYVNLYDSFLESECIVIVGFGFNVDDSHINGLFRSLIEKENKQIYYVTVDSRPNEQIKRQVLLNLRLPQSCRNQIHILNVDPNERTVEGENWLSVIHSMEEI